MRKFYTLVVRHRKAILILFFAAAFLCVFMRNLVAVNYDMTDYLPEDSPSTIALDLMEQEFDSGIPNARVMIQNVSVTEALEYKDRLLDCPGVCDVLWLDDSVSIYQPLAVMDQDLLDTYYTDRCALFTVTIDENQRVETVQRIRSIIGEENAMDGDAVSTALATTSTVEQIPKIAIAAVLFTMLVLFVTTSSWFEPIVIMTGLGVAVIINAGTNLIFGEISFVTNAAGSILQLAVSLDYSVFLIHRFEECRDERSDPEEAMIEALCRSTMSILSSGVTTVIGFLALAFMRFQIGPDLGFALAKGIALSLITVFVFMPALILTSAKPVGKTRHRSFVPGFEKTGRLISRAMIPMVCVFSILIIPCYLASNSNAFYYGSSKIFGEETQLGQDRSRIESVFGKNNTYALMLPKDSPARERALSDALHELPQIRNILSYTDTVGSEIPPEYLDADTLSQLQSDTYTRMILTVEADYEGQETFALVKEIRETAERSYPGSYYLAGEGVSTYDLMDSITADMLKVNLIAIASVVAVLLISMKSVLLPLILALSIETAIWINLSVPYFCGSVIFYISYLIISSIQLGATVDYAILLTDRYMENRRSMGKRESVIQTISAVTVSILTSGILLTVVGFLLGYISTHGVLSQLGIFLGRGALLSMIIVLFVLPGLLFLCDGLIQRTTKGTDWYQPASSKEAITK
ncbi:MAG: RND family transporter [Anaerovoracaceae bacterium]